MSRLSQGSVSWVQMELYHIGELSKAETSRVAAYLESAPSPDVMDVTIRNDKRPMPPLCIDEIWNIGPSWTQRLSGPVWGFAAAACVALVIAVLVTDSKRRDILSDDTPVRIKGGETALSVIRNRNDLLTANPKTYRDGDRLKLNLTTAATEPFWAEIVVQQGSELFFPYDDLVEIKGGNRVSLPGAIGLTGTGRVTICILALDPMPSRTAIRRDGIPADTENIACVELEDRAEKELSK